MLLVAFSIAADKLYRSVSKHCSQNKWVFEWYRLPLNQENYKYFDEKTRVFNLNFRLENPKIYIGLNTSNEGQILEKSKLKYNFITNKPSFIETNV